MHNNVRNALEPVLFFNAYHRLQTFSTLENKKFPLVILFMAYRR